MKVPGYQTKDSEGYLAGDSSGIRAVAESSYGI